MKAALVILCFAAAASSQTHVGGCGPSSPATGEAEPGRRSPAGGAIAAKPEPPQIQYRRMPPTQRPSCWCGSVSFTALNSAAVAQEISLLNGVAGKFRFDHILLQEEKQFVSDKVDRVKVSVGIPGSKDDVISGFTLKSGLAPQNFVLEVPKPPSLTGPYDLVLKFTGSSPLGDGGTSNFSAGSLNWEVCGGQV